MDEREPTTGSETPDADAPDAETPLARRRPRRLTRSRRDRVVAGVAGGLGEYFGVDPVVFRIGFVAATLLGGSGVLLYLVGWLVLPEERRKRSVGHDMMRRGTAPTTVGILLVVVGVAFLLHDFTFWGPRRLTLSLILLAGGAYLLWRAPVGSDDPGNGSPDGRDEGPDDDPDAEPDDEPDDGDDGPDLPVASRDLSESFAERPGDDPDVGEQDDTVVDETLPPPPAPPPPAAPVMPASEPPPGPERRRRRRRRRSPLGRITLSVLLILAGLAGLADAAGAFDVTARGFLAVALVVTGLGLVVGAWWGRARSLMVLGVVLTATLAVASAVDVPIRGGVGERTYRPTTLAEVDSEYRLFAGEMVIDLTEVEFPRGVTAVEASVVFGQLTVIVPDEVTVDARARATAGEVRLLGTANDGRGRRRGIGSKDRVVVPGPTGSGTLRLDLEVAAGEIEVLRGTS